MNDQPRIQVSLDELKKDRVRDINALFKTLAKRQGKIVVNLTSSNNTLVFGVSDNNENGSDFLNWRFKTKTENYSALYYERWIPYEADIYYLDRMYFHIYKTDISERRAVEYICLHCDANEPDDAQHARFKQSPHLHFSTAEQPLPHSHIALNNGNLNQIFSSLASLHQAIKQAVDMIYWQILIPIKDLQPK